MPRGFQDYAERNGIAEEFADVVALVAEQKKYREETRALALRECKHGPQQAGGRLLKGLPVFGPLLNLPGSSSDPPIFQTATNWNTLRSDVVFLQQMPERPVRHLEQFRGAGLHAA